MSGWWFQPIWKIWGNGKDYPIYYGKLNMFQTTNQMCIFGYFRDFPRVSQRLSNFFPSQWHLFLGNFQWFHAPRHFRLSGSSWLHMTRQGLPTRRPLPGPGARPGDVSWLPAWYTKKTSIESIESIVTTLNYTIRYYKYHKPNQYSSYEPCIYIYIHVYKHIAWICSILYEGTHIYMKL